MVRHLLRALGLTSSRRSAVPHSGTRDSNYSLPSTPAASCWAIFFRPAKRDCLIDGTKHFRQRQPHNRCYEKQIPRPPRRARDDNCKKLRCGRLKPCPFKALQNFAFSLLYVSSSASGRTRVSPTTVMKLASATQRGRTCMWMCPVTPAPAALPMFMPRFTPSG